jgi:hypothetical protein
MVTHACIDPARLPTSTLASTTAARAARPQLSTTQRLVHLSSALNTVSFWSPRQQGPLVVPCAQIGLYVCVAAPEFGTHTDPVMPPSVRTADVRDFE